MSKNTCTCNCDGKDCCQAKACACCQTQCCC